MPAFSRTIGPLHFEDLEPRRFEDLVRQLAYDFRAWEKLEPLGRTGSDEGFDVRGLEANADLDALEEDEAEETTVSPQAAASRIWLIQCKRERTITPKKIADYLDDIPPEERKTLHGLVFVVACDFSKKAHDAFRDWCVTEGIQEFHLWGKAALEDQLFRPKNDHLLFAYFGVSLNIKQRSARTALRSITTTKRKLKRVTQGGNVELLIRDALDDQYPHIGRKEREKAPALRRNRWRVAKFEELTHKGVRFLTGRYFAFLDDDQQHWDFANVTNDAECHRDRWNADPDRYDLRGHIFDFWQTLPDQSKGWFEVYGYVPYEDVLEVDEIGDDLTPLPHVFINWPNHAYYKDLPFSHFTGELKAGGFTLYNPELQNRVAKFLPAHRALTRVERERAGLPETDG